MAQSELMPGPVSDAVAHRLDAADLAALSRGIVTAAVVGQLLAAERSKHLLLVEAVRRQAERQRLTSDRVLLSGAIRLLSEVETHSPAVVADIAMLPQIGRWAVTCLRRMTAAGDLADQRDMGSLPPLRSDLGYLAAVAAAAALRTRVPFDLRVPLRHGTLHLPGLGTARLDSGHSSGTARVRLDGDMVVISSRHHKLALRAKTGSRPRCDDRRWSELPRLRIQAGGLDLNVVIDCCDPFLPHLVEPTTRLSAADLITWQHRLEEAWEILVRHHRATAKALAAGVSTLIPLAGTVARPRSLTSGWAFGAIGLTLPADGVSLAETLVHELHHLVLGAVEDIVPLGADDSRLGYAPWRDDPRPAVGLLHGCYAYLGVTAFWRRQRRVGTSAQRLRGAVEFARWRQATLDAATGLATSSALTETGARFAVGICRQLTGWQGAAVPAEAKALAAEMRTEHRVRWRLAHVRPAAATIDALARAWHSGVPASFSETDHAETTESAQLSGGPPQLRAFLLQMRYRDPPQFGRLMSTGGDVPGFGKMAQSISEADAALLRGEFDIAAQGYRRRLEADDDSDAWIGLAVAMTRGEEPAAAQLLAERPEVVAALLTQLRLRQQAAPDIGLLLNWLAEALREHAGLRGV